MGREIDATRRPTTSVKSARSMASKTPVQSWSVSSAAALAHIPSSPAFSARQVDDRPAQVRPRLESLERGEPFEVIVVRRQQQDGPSAIESDNLQLIGDPCDIAIRELDVRIRLAQALGRGRQDARHRRGRKYRACRLDEIGLDL